MPIDTRLDGQPEQVRATARWLRDQLAFEVGAGATAMTTTRAEAAQGWQGAAGSAFGDRMSREASAAGELRATLEDTAGRLTELADQLDRARQHMAAAREVAANGGLAVDGYLIGDPGTAPAAPDPAATPAVLAAHTDAVAGYQRQANAYVVAEGEARQAGAVQRFLADTWTNMADDVRQKWFLISGDAVNGFAGGLLGEHVRVLRAHGDSVLEQAKRLEAHYVNSQGGSAHSRSLIKLISEETAAGRAAQQRAAAAGARLAGKVPVIGAVITVAGIGYDIQRGKPAAKAVASGAGGMGASILGGMAGGALAGTMGFGPVGTVVGAVAGGVVAGVVTSGVIDAAYDRLPDGVHDAFAEGQAAVGKALGEVGDDAGKLWDKIF
ncbi:WXG100 family type VII secretion target [Actinoplanes sp. DH11]|uniref:WXG100 family type VII secretion target n=1 Tax=Actinoplanes sp. DH11 TaxID=2857011 RepID=UPI001E652942|nr:WXG100 family type VII secretion target [Actinoplanes sp. DH11]